MTLGRSGRFVYGYVAPGGVFLLRDIETVHGGLSRVYGDASVFHDRGAFEQAAVECGIDRVELVDAAAFYVHQRRRWLDWLTGVVEVGLAALAWLAWRRSLRWLQREARK
jgi:hypothetical protein